MSQQTGTNRERAAGFVESYRRAWETWDFSGFVDLFSDDVVYVAHATQETVVGRAPLAAYVRKEAADQGQANGKPGHRRRPCRGRVLGYADQRR
jgi:ketosteroid isomerase-like protein